MQGQCCEGKQSGFVFRKQRSFANQILCFIYSTYLILIFFFDLGSWVGQGHLEFASSGWP